MPKIFSYQKPYISPFLSTANCPALLCPRLIVVNAGYAGCNGVYEATQVRIFPSYFFWWIFFPQTLVAERVVYINTEKDRWGLGNVCSRLKIFGCRIIWFNPNYPGWSIGNLEFGTFYSSRFIYIQKSSSLDHNPTIFRWISCQGALAGSLGQWGHSQLQLSFWGYSEIKRTNWLRSLISSFFQLS